MLPVARPPHDQWFAVDWAARTHDVVLHGRRLRYVDIGDGPPLILVHGLGGSWQTWLENLPALATQHRVVALDLPGFGRSEELASPIEVSDLVSTVCELMDALGIGRAALGGHSMGGLIALCLATSHPERVSELVLVSAGGVRLSRMRLALIVKSFTAFHALFQVRGVPLAFARRPLLRRALLSAALDDWRRLTPELAAEIIPPMSAPGFIPAVHAAANAADSVDPKLITSPVLLIWGRQDRILPIETARALCNDLADARLVVLDRVGHCAMFEEPDEFNRMTLAFLAGDRGDLDPPSAVPDVSDVRRPRRREVWRERRRTRRAEKRIRTKRGVRHDRARHDRARQHAGRWLG
jgi:pimeloyl-ACP methyl ester carboxylesterase